MLDLVVRGGEVIDGTGAPRRRADVGIRDGRIAVIGNVDAEAAVTVDARDRVVTPGFIDVHSHFDAQFFWDGALTPSPLHGVTTTLSGNCGFSIAPVSDRADDVRYLMRLLARVEGMPLEALQTGVPWDWSSTASFLDRAEGSVAINIGFMVGHSAVRRLVMGPDATRRPADDDEIRRMERLVREACEAGALGFSTSWARTHNDADGDMVPSRYATAEELLALSRAAGSCPGTSLEIIPTVGPTWESWAFELMAELSAVAQRPLNWNLLTVTAATLEPALAKLRGGDMARARGGKVVGLMMPINLHPRLSLLSGFVLDAVPGWEEAMLLPKDAKLALLRDAGSRARLKALADDPRNPMARHTDWPNIKIFDVVAPENEQYRGQRLGDIADARGADPWDVLCEIAVADELLTSFGIPTAPETRADWEARLSVMRDERTIIGGSDAGAHLDLLATFNYATHILAEAVRRHAVMSLEEAIHHLTRVPADLYGIKDRGVLREGAHGDIVVLDPRTVGTVEPSMRFDLPDGSGRLYAEATGIDHVIVNGTMIVSGGALTGMLPGHVLRSGTHTETPSLD
jgi:N-acyl-D-aspartate/D-glutamate deacylase